MEEFLSLCSHANAEQIPLFPGDLRVHEFLQPVEHSIKSAAKGEIATAEKIPAHQPDVISGDGVGLASYPKRRIRKKQRSLTPENDSNCSSCGGCQLVLWEESSGKNGNYANDNRGITSDFSREMEMSERASNPSTNGQENNNLYCPSCPRLCWPKTQSFMEMIKLAQGRCDQSDDLGDEEEHGRKESHSPLSRELNMKMGGKEMEQQVAAHTPRSKHSATEQRRRSKINERFQLLRELIPHNDQKRDRASFLLEVIEYIQLLQKRIKNYEESWRRWNREPEKLVPWRSTAEGEEEAAMNEEAKQHDFSIEGGTISISSTYSHRLLNSLTEALQSGGVDLSQASISVQIQLGSSNPANPNRITSSSSKAAGDVDGIIASNWRR